MNRSEMETRRLSALPELNQCVTGLARRVGVTRMTIYRWKKAVAAGEDLGRKFAKRRPNLLNDRQREELREVWAAGPAANGWKAKRWNRGMFTAEVLRRTGVDYNEDHVGRMMKKWKEAK